MIILTRSQRVQNPKYYKHHCFSPCSIPSCRTGKSLYHANIEKKFQKHTIHRAVALAASQEEVLNGVKATL